MLHIAGPFSATSKPMADACLRTGTHYFDITGEIDVFEALAARDAEATKAGIMLLPGVGFDVVPSDCLAVHLKQRMPDAIDLKISIGGLNALSHGTAKSMVEGVAWFTCAPGWSHHYAAATQGDVIRLRRRAEANDRDTVG